MVECAAASCLPWLAMQDEAMDGEEMRTAEGELETITAALVVLVMNF